MLVSTWLSRISIVIISGKSVRIVNYTEVSMQETAKEEGEHPMVYVSDIYIYTL